MTKKPTKRTTATKGGTWAGIGSSLVGVASMLPPGSWQLGVGILGTLLAGVGGPLASHIDAKKANGTT